MRHGHGSENEEDAAASNDADGVKQQCERAAIPDTIPACANMTERAEKIANGFRIDSMNMKNAGARAVRPCHLLRVANAG